MFKCKYCGKEFENKNQLGGHIIWCKENTNRSGKCNFNKQNNNKVVQKRDYICQYCGKIVGNAGCLTLHERYCDKNPNKELWVKKDTYKSTSRVAWNKGLTAETDERVNKGRLSLRKSIETGEYVPKRIKHTEETKNKLSVARKNWLLNNKDKHVWKRNNKFVSIPCENVKKFLRDNNISFVEEYQPLDNYNFAIDIAFPNKRIGIEINGNQHYDKDGLLTKYYKFRHDTIEQAGWKLYEIHYSNCFDFNNSFYSSLLALDILDDDYTDFIKQYKSKKDIKLQKQIEHKKEIANKKRLIFDSKRNQIIYAINNCKINFAKYGWSEKLKKYLIEHNLFYTNNILKMLKTYYPEFLQDNDVFIRKYTSSCSSNGRATDFIQNNPL